MGFDISYHPMSRTQMEEWYFAPLKALRDGDESVLNALMESQGEEFFHEKFVDHMKYFTSIDNRWILPRLSICTRCCFFVCNRKTSRDG